MNGEVQGVPGYPHIVSEAAARQFGAELVEEITAEGFVVVPVEEFLWMEQRCKTHLWGQLCEHAVSAPIENLPLPLWRHALSQWNPTAGNPFAARRSPQKPPAETRTLQEALKPDRAPSEGDTSRPNQPHQS